MMNVVPKTQVLRNDYTFQNCIGEGQIGKVYRAIDVSGQATRGRTSREVVVKVYSCCDGGKTFNNEVEMLKRVNSHPNVVQILASYSVGRKAIIMPCYGRYDFHQYVWQCDGLSEFQAAGITNDVLSALQHVHDCGIIHRDVKPENIVLGQDGKAVLLDFDLACYASDTLATYMMCGSAGFMAPEIIKGKPCSFLSDLFSVGCVVYFMIAKVTPFLRKKGMTVSEIMDANEECNLTFGRRFNNVSPDYMDFVVSLVVSDPERRLSELHASTHPWFSCEDTTRCKTPMLERIVPLVDVGSCTDAASSNDVFSMHFEGTHSVPTVQSSAHKTGITRSRASKAKIIGRNIVSKLSRVFQNTRRKASTVSPLESKDEDRTEGLTQLTGVLIRG